MHVLKYLKGTINHGLFYSAISPLQLTAFCDADWGSCKLSAKSLPGYCIFLGSSLVSWKTKKQKIVSKSSAEAEYRAMSVTTSELECCNSSWHISMSTFLYLFLYIVITKLPFTLQKIWSSMTKPSISELIAITIGTSS